MPATLRSALIPGVNPPPDESAILAIESPNPSLWHYYLLTALVIPPLFPVVILPLYFRYHTMRYKFSAEGISMSWGILFRREIIVNYARIQDIHLRSNFIERWLGLGRVLVQTASGNSAAELTIEGLKEYEALRDFLYSRMRGVKDHPPHAPAPAAAPAAASVPSGELAAALRETAAELRALREELARRPRA
ncbi:MAG: PH domain-containing protein [Verrucomicrobia bacterium]|nr:PH domain-containing protein [Verrucomicrobiota bacterium]